MFGRKPPGPGESSPQPVERVAPTAFQPPKPVAAAAPSNPRPAAPATARPASDGDAAPPPRPAPIQMPTSAGPASPPARRPAEPAREIRKLIIGREITLTGEIAACDHLIVEGTVEASVKDCHRLEVAETGLFRGAVEINEADIAGRFEGQITVQGRLAVRSTGRIDGKIQYGELAVDAGGALDGEIRWHGKKAVKPEKGPRSVADAPLLNPTAPTPAEDPS
jgi:cytoskeletal protein CcmA (bactofilin family)